MCPSPTEAHWSCSLRNHLSGNSHVACRHDGRAEALSLSGKIRNNHVIEYSMSVFHIIQAATKIVISLWWTCLLQQQICNLYYHAWSESSFFFSLQHLTPSPTLYGKIFDFFFVEERTKLSASCNIHCVLWYLRRAKKCFFLFHNCLFPTFQHKKMFSFHTFHQKQIYGITRCGSTCDCTNSVFLPFFPDS